VARKCSLYNAFADPPDDRPLPLVAARYRRSHRVANPLRRVLYSQQMSREGELRRHTRAERSSPVQIVWKDRAGVDKYINGRSLDVSPSGMRVEISEPIEKQTYVTLQCVALALHGTASVRTCARKGTKYVVGLEFSGGLQWKPKDPKPQ
jgi:hypothetical protein